MNCANSFGLISRSLASQNELRLFETKHFVGSNALNPDSDTSVRNLDFLRGSSSNLMRNDGMSMRLRLRNEIEICHLQERADCSGLIILATGPTTDLCQSWKDGGIRFQEKAITTTCGPSCQFIRASLNLVADFFGTENQALRVRRDQPIPEGGSEIQAVVQVLGLNENIGIQKIAHASPTPRLRPSSLNVESFEKPSIRKASL